MSPILTLFIAVAAIVISVYFSNKAMQKIAAAWQQTAELVGGRFVPQAGSWFNKSAMQVLAEVEGVRVTVDHYTVSHGKSSTTYTRIQAAASAPPALSLKIYVEGIFSSIGKALGTQDVEVGDREFDDVFMVKASDEDMARAWLGPEFRKVSLETREYTVALAACSVTSTRVGLERDPARLARAMRQAALLAGRGKKLLSRWRGLAKDLGGETRTAGLLWPGEPGAAIRTEQHGALITIALVPAATSGERNGDFRLGTTVSAERTASSGEGFTIRRRSPADPPGADPFRDPAFAQAYTLQAADPSRTLRRFSDEVRRQILALEPAEMSGTDAAVSLVLEGAQMGRKRIESAVAIVAALAAPMSEGPYR